MGPDIVLLVVLASTAGAAIGTFTGLIPGIHVNTAATLLLGAYPVMESMIGGIADPSYTPVLLSCCIMSASAVHSFVDFVPSVFIGSPDADDTVSMLPGHRLLKQGLGMTAVRSAAIGSVIGSITALTLAIPIQWIMLQGAKGYIDYFTSGVIIVTLSVIILTSCNPIVSGLMVGITGMLGYGINHLDIPVISLIGEGSLIFPLLTGLFGIPLLLENTPGRSGIIQRDPCKDPVGPVPGLKGVITGLLAGWFPGVTSTAGALLTASFTKENDPARFISMTASIGTVTAVFSLITLSVSGSGRSGTCMVVKEVIGNKLDGFCSEGLVLILLSMAIASMMGYGITIASGRLMSGIYAKVPEQKINCLILVIMVAMVVLFTGPFGLALMVIAVALGMVPQYSGISRVCMTGCLMVPVLIGQL